MSSDSPMVAALRSSKRWADFASIVSVGLMIILMAFTAYLAQLTAADPPTQVGMYLTMIGVVLVVCVWQAAAFVVAALQVILQKTRSGGVD